MDDFGLWMKTRYLLKNLDDDILRERQNELLDILGGLRKILSISIDSLARNELLSLCNLLFPSEPVNTISLSSGINSFSLLPDEMINLVCNYLNIIDLKNLQCTCCQFAITSRAQLSIYPAINNSDFKKEILCLISSETSINTKFLSLSSLINLNIGKYNILIRNGIISKLVEFIKYDNKKCNFKYKYESMKLLIELSNYNTKYLSEICFSYNVLSSFYNLCLSDPVSKLLHYTSSQSTECNLNKNDRLIMETDNKLILAYRWDPNEKKWRNVCGNNTNCEEQFGRVCVYQNICSGLHKFMFISSKTKEIYLLQYIDNQQGVTCNNQQDDYSIYWRGDDYKMHTNGIWKFKFIFKNKKQKYRQQAIQLYDCFITYSSKDNQSVGSKIITQLDNNNIFDHFYWLTSNLQQHIIKIIEGDADHNDIENNIEELYNLLLYIINKKNNRNDEIEHIIGCGLINKIILYITPYSYNYKLTKYSIKIIKLLIINKYIILLNKYNLIQIFYNILIDLIKDDYDENNDQLIQDIIEIFGEIALIGDEWRHESIKIGFLKYIFNNVLSYNAIIQSISVSTIYKFFNNFNNLDFAMINDNLIQLIPNILIQLLESSSSDYYDDFEMQKQLLLIIESFCDGTNSEYRSRIIVVNNCLKYICINILSESIKDILNKNNKKKIYEAYNIENICIRIIGNVLCDCIWSDFEDKTIKILNEINYLQIIHKLWALTNSHTQKRDILWSLSNILMSNKGIEWICKYKQIIFDIIILTQTNNNENNQNNQNENKLKFDAGWCLCNAYRHSTIKQKNILLKCGFQNVLLSLIGIHKFHGNQKKMKKIKFLIQQIVKSTLEINNNNNNNNINTNNQQESETKINTKKYELQLKHILQRQNDTMYLNHLKKLLDIIQSGYIA